jgi:hypothetical protein
MSRIPIMRTGGENCGVRQDRHLSAAPASNQRSWLANVVRWNADSFERQHLTCNQP